MRVLSFGSLNIDYVYEVPRFVGGGETLSALSLSRFSGGKGLNQSVALARAGLEVRHAGAVGRDGLFLLEELRAAGADTGYVEVLEDVSTGHAVIQRTPAGENCILLYGGANRRITREHIDRVLSDFGPGDALVLQNEISELPYLAEQAKKRDMTVALNPSPMEEGLLSLLPSAGYLILNEIEASQLLRGLGKPVPEAGEALAEALAEALPSSAAIVLTLGPQGSLCAAGGRLNKTGGGSRPARGHHGGGGRLYRLFPGRGPRRAGRGMGHGIRLRRRGHRRHPAWGRALHSLPGGGPGGDGRLI